MGIIAAIGTAPIISGCEGSKEVEYDGCTVHLHPLPYGVQILTARDKDGRVIMNSTDHPGGRLFEEITVYDSNHPAFKETFSNDVVKAAMKGEVIEVGNMKVRYLPELGKSIAQIRYDDLQAGHIQKCSGQVTFYLNDSPEGDLLSRICNFKWVEGAHKAIANQNFNRKNYTVARN